MSNILYRILLLLKVLMVLISLWWSMLLCLMSWLWNLWNICLWLHWITMVSLWVARITWSGVALLAVKCTTTVHGLRRLVVMTWHTMTRWVLLYHLLVALMLVIHVTNRLLWLARCTTWKMTVLHLPMKLLVRVTIWELVVPFGTWNCSILCLLNFWIHRNRFTNFQICILFLDAKFDIQNSLP